MSSLLGIGGGGNVGSAGGSFYDYSIDQSLRFDGSTSYLEFTPTANAATDSSKMTFSTWLKIWGGEGVSDGYILSAGSSNVDGVFYPTYDKFAFVRAGSAHLVGNAVRRDPSAWYHLYVTYDADGDGYARIYVNGVLDNETAQTIDLAKLGVQNQIQRLVRKSNAGTYSDLYLAETHFIDGSIVPISTFGETKNGVWVPVQTSGITYGNNGWYLDYADSSDVGKDVSGRGNHWTAYNLPAESVVADSPTNNFCHWNPLINTNQTRVFRDGAMNLFSSAQTWSNNQWNQGTIGVTGGTSDTKFYFEFIANVGGSGYIIGVGRAASKATGYTTYDGAVYLYNTACYSDSTATVTGLTSASALDVIRIAFDASNGKVWIGNASGWFNSGDPAAGTGEVGTISNYEGEILVPILNRPDLTNGYMIINCGQDDTFAGVKTTGSAAAQDDNGIGKFYLTPPSSFLALCTSNLPEPTIGPNSGDNEQADDYFNTVLYTGTGASNSITVGFQPDFTWIKRRDTTADHQLVNSVVGYPNGTLLSNQTDAEYTAAARVDSRDSNGFTVSTPTQVNASGGTYASWNWKAGGNADTFNIDGTGYSTASAASLDGGDITPTGASINTAAGFSIISYTGNGSADQTIKHGLSSDPELTIIKCRDTNTNNNQWQISSSKIGDDYVYFTTAAFTGTAGVFPTSGDTTKVTIGRTGNNVKNTNELNKDFIMYNFHSVDGFCKVGKYLTNNANDGVTVLTGFRPKFVMIKRTDGTVDWQILDSERATYNPNDKRLEPNTNAGEATTSASSDFYADFLSNGFKLRGNGSAANGGVSATVIYLAFAEAPFKYANAR